MNRTDSNGPYWITSADIADREALDQLNVLLRTYNDQQSPQHRAIRAGGGTPLELYVRDGAGTLIGGLLAETYWGWLSIDRLVISEALRGQGYGRRLMEQAEQIARERGCAHAHLTTYSFQAPRFYEKLGYRIVGQLDDYPPGMSYYWMRKDFAAEQSAADPSAADQSSAMEQTQP